MPISARRRSIFVSAVFLLSVAAACAQGPLTPAGAPAPSMKSLDQIASTGIAINAINTPGNDNADFFIGLPGTYYLTGNITATKQTCISIDATGVIIDLNGFEIFCGVDGANGIANDGLAGGCVVRNGSIRAFAHAINITAKGCFFSQLAVSESIGPAITAGDGAVLDQCRVYNNYGGAITLGYGCTLTNCTVTGNLAGGVFTGSGSILRNCTVSANMGFAGIQVGSGSVLEYCTAGFNSGTSGNSFGIYSDGKCTIVGCTVTGNTNTGAPAGPSTGGGIYAFDGSVIKDCSVQGNKGDGIQVFYGCTISGCTASGNGGSGIAAQTDNTLTNCTTNDNSGNGITTGRGCKITDCTASSNEKAGIATDQACTVTNTTARRNVLTGLQILDNSLVQGCNASENFGDGITLTSACVVLNSSACGNGVAATKDGIRLLAGSGSRIEGNNASNNSGFGIHQEGGPDLIVRNTARGNASGTNYMPGAGPSLGPIGTPNTATSPWANFQ